MNDITKAEKRGYSKGYAAGQRRKCRQGSEKRIRAEREKFKRQVFLAALTGTLQNGNWSNGEKRWADIPDYCNGCWKFANEAVGATHFDDPLDLGTPHD